MNWLEQAGASAYNVRMSDKLAIAVDFGGTSIKIGVTCGAELVDKAEPLPTPAFDSPEAIMAAMCATMKELQRKHPQVTAVGLGMPGWVDFYKGVLYQLTNVPVWNHQVLRLYPYLPRSQNATYIGYTPLSIS